MKTDYSAAIIWQNIQMTALLSEPKDIDNHL